MLSKKRDEKPLKPNKVDTQPQDFSHDYLIPKIKKFYHKHYWDFQLPNVIKWNIDIGICSGFSALFLISQNIQRKHTKKYLSLDDIPENYKSNPPYFNYSLFLLIIKVISSWDECKTLSPKEKYLFCLFIHAIIYYQNLEDPLNEHYQLEFEPLSFSANEEKLADLLDIMIKPERMLRLDGGMIHALSIYKNASGQLIYHDANLKSGPIVVRDNTYLAQMIFKSCAIETLKYNSERFSPFILSSYIDHDQKSDEYPEPSKLFSDLMLIDNRDINYANGMTAACLAIINGLTKSFKYFLPHHDINVSRDEKGYTMLMRAVYHENIEIINTLLPESKNPMAPIADGNTVLHIAATSTNAEVMDVLLNFCKAKNINLNIDAIEQKEGKTALLVALFHNNPELALKLLNAGANAKAICKLGMSTINYACSHSENPMMKEVILILLKNGADPNGRYTNGTTPLMQMASKKENTDLYLIRKLLEYHADARMTVKTKHFTFNVLDFSENKTIKTFFSNHLKEYEAPNIDRNYSGCFSCFFKFSKENNNISKDFKQHDTPPAVNSKAFG